MYIYIYIYIYPLMYTPLPNCTWLHHRALRYLQRVQLGAHMRLKGLNSVKTGSKWAKKICLSIPDGPGSHLEKCIFHPFFTHFCSQKGPFSRQSGLSHGPKCVISGSKWVKNTCLSIPNGPGSLLEKCIFDPFLTHCWSQNGPFSRHFGIFHGPKRGTTGSKRPKSTCLSIPSGLGPSLEKSFFFAPGTLVDLPLAPTMRGPGCPPSTPSDHWFGGLGVLLGDSEAWKPQKLGGCGWNRCPRNWDLSHVAQDTARSWIWACLTQTAHMQAIFGHFWAVAQTYCGARGQQRALGHGAIEAHVECSNRLPCLAIFTGFWGRFGPKKGCFGAQNVQFWEGTSQLGAHAPGRHR